jgi:hypothetical protein
MGGSLKRPLSVLRNENYVVVEGKVTKRRFLNRNSLHWEKHGVVEKVSDWLVF